MSETTFNELKELKNERKISTNLNKFSQWIFANLILYKSFKLILLWKE